MDYLIVIWLLAGFRQTRRGGNLAVLLSGWAFTNGVFYMAFFISRGPELAPLIKPNPTLLLLIGLMLLIALLGLLTTALAHQQKKA